MSPTISMRKTIWRLRQAGIRCMIQTRTSSLHLRLRSGWCTNSGKVGFTAVHTGKQVQIHHEFITLTKKIPCQVSSFFRSSAGKPVAFLSHKKIEQESHPETRIFAEPQDVWELLEMRADRVQGEQDAANSPKWKIVQESLLKRTKKSDALRGKI